MLVRGSGVNTDRYRALPGGEPSRPGEAPAVSLASRLLETKGIYELIEAARSLKARGVKARFLICGEPDPGNPASIPPARIEEWRGEGVVELLGHVDPIDPLIARAAIVVLPSYREGMPKILLEASWMEKAVVSTDVPGARGGRGRLVGFWCQSRMPRRSRRRSRSCWLTPACAPRWGKRGASASFASFPRRRESALRRSRCTKDWGSNQRRVE